MPYKLETNGFYLDKLNVHRCNDIHKDEKFDITVFRSKLKSGFIDVWWLYDDGGEK